MLPGSESYTDSFYLNFFLVLSVLALPLFALVLELAEVHNPAYGRVSGGCNLDQIQLFFNCEPQRFGRFYDSQILTILVDDADRRDANVLICAISPLNCSYAPLANI